jgi:hypothetical protein
LIDTIILRDDHLLHQPHTVLRWQGPARYPIYGPGHAGRIT